MQEEHPDSDEQRPAAPRMSYAEFARYRLRRRHSSDRRQGIWRFGFAALLTFGIGFLLSALLAATAGSLVMREYDRFGDNMQDAAAVVASLPQGGSRIYDRNGQMLYEYRTANVRRYVSLDEISPWMQKATIATEDASFWENSGININGLVRAALENFTPFASNGMLEGSGGSSITQQLAKNVYIDADQRFERSITRKMTETVLALQLTQRYSKTQILEWYLNSISYGGQYVGIEAASEGYFNKPAKDLTIGEAAMLAGIPQRPAAYDPTQNPQAAAARQREVLDLMVRHGVASTTETENAHAEVLDIKPSEVPMLAPHFVFGPVAQQIEAQFGTNALAQGGLEITTSLDLGLQQQGQQIVEKWISTNEQLSGGHNGALYALDARDGSVLVYIGSRDYFRDDISGRNDNVQGLNSPGSTLKPFTYMNAFMHGWSPNTALLDVPITLKDGQTGANFVPRDPSQSYLGVITAAKALGNSLNIPAVQAIQFAGVNDTANLLRRMGLETIDPSPNYYGPALTLGGVDVSLQDLTYAYSVLADGGVMRGVPTVSQRPNPSRKLDPAVILKVTDSRGKVLYERTKPDEERVIPESYAYIATSVISDGANQCITWGACGALQLPGRPSAQKTGTSEPFENTKTLIGDTWAVGYTPQIVAGTWFGNSNNAPMQNIYSTTVSWQIWKDFMVAAHDRLKLAPQQFVRPSSVVERQVCAGSGKLPTDACPQSGRVNSLFAAEALSGAKPLAQYDDWWHKTPTGLSLTLPPTLMAWQGGTAWASAAFAYDPVLAAAVPGATPTPGPSPVPGTAQFSSTGTLPVGGRGPNVQLSTPSSGSVVKGGGAVLVSGTASSPNLASVTVELSTANGTWTTIGAVPGDIANGVPMVWVTWDSSSVPNGAYALRVVARDRNGQAATTISAVTVSH